MTPWQGVFASCLASLIASFAVLTRRQVMVVLEWTLRDLRLDEIEEENRRSMT